MKLETIDKLCKKAGLFYVSDKETLIRFTELVELEQRKTDSMIAYEFAELPLDPAFSEDEWHLMCIRARAIGRKIWNVSES